MCSLSVCSPNRARPASPPPAGHQYEARLRQQHNKLHPRTAWASLKKAERRRRRVAEGGASDSEDEEVGIGWRRGWRAGRRLRCLLLLLLPAVAGSVGCLWGAVQCHGAVPACAQPYPAWAPRLCYMRITHAEGLCACAQPPSTRLLLGALRRAAPRQRRSGCCSARAGCWRGARRCRRRCWRRRGSRMQTRPTPAREQSSERIKPLL